MLSRQEILERLLVGFPKVKRGNSSEDLLNEIRQIAQLLHQVKERKALFNNIINFIKNFHLKWISFKIFLYKF